MATNLTNQQAFSQVQSDITALVEVPKTSLTVTTHTDQSTSATDAITIQSILTTDADPTNQITVSNNAISLPAGLYAYYISWNLGTPSYFNGYDVSLGLYIESSITNNTGTSYQPLICGDGRDYAVNDTTSGRAVNNSSSGILIGPCTVEVAVSNDTSTSLDSTVDTTFTITKIAMEV